MSGVERRECGIGSVGKLGEQLVRVLWSAGIVWIVRGKCNGRCARETRKVMTYHCYVCVETKGARCCRSGSNDWY